MHWDRQSRLSTFFNSPERVSHRSSSILTRSSSPSSSHSDLPATLDTHQNANPVVLGVCAMDVKARSKAMREILIRLVERARGSIEVKVFGDKVILDEDVENWPRCDILISFFSTDFPLDKAISYVKLRNPFCINDLAPQALLWDRRLVGAVLDHLKVPTPPRLEVTRDGGPKIDPDLINLMKQRHGITLGGYQVTPEVILREDGDAIIIDGKVLEKPFVEKPVSGEDHNVYIYFKGGGGRRLFRKVGNKSSDLDPTLNHPRTDGSYIYEKFIDVDNSEDIKVYTVGKEYTHAETRKSPVVDGVVRRNTEGKEIRFITRLTEAEKAWATRICEGFGQRVCGFDMLRCDNGKKSQVIDVNGWSFVKGNNTYYGTAFIFRGISVSVHRGNVSWNIRSSEGMKFHALRGLIIVTRLAEVFLYYKAADILAALCMRLSSSPDRALPGAENMSVETPTWLLKANVTVYRHADRTPKQKLKFNFPIGEPWTQPFVTLLNGEKEEIILREKDQLNLIATAVEEAKRLGADGEELNKLTQLNNALFSKIDLPGTKAQLKPVYSKRQAGHVRRLTKLTLVFKWGGEFTHSARYQSRDLGENMKKDISIMNREVLQNVKIFTSSERRVIASAEIFAASLYDTQSPAYTMNTSSNSSSRSSTDGSTNGSGSYMNSPHPETPLTLIVRKDLLDDSNAAKDLMDDVKKRLKILLATCMKKEPVEVVKEVIELLGSFRDIMHRNFETMDVDKIQERWCAHLLLCMDFILPLIGAVAMSHGYSEKDGKSCLKIFVTLNRRNLTPHGCLSFTIPIKYCALHHRTFLFAIFDENGRRDPLQPHDRKLHELYGRAKALFDLVAPQEYGIDPDEKEEIGVLTSLPLLHNVVQDLEAARNNGGSSLTLYFTKESHIHTLVNLVLLSGLPIANRRIPELDYASHITFELYERNHGRGKSDKEYSIKISLSEGAHSSNVLDSTLDARHSLNVQSRRKLTQHLPYSLVIEKLSKHFHRLSELEDEDTGPDTPFETVEALPALDSGSEDV
ncbi:cortical actin cytoskeleton protein asp1 [Armillaria luteobubalina]|uniref:Inositol hexakisphosphate and diphosphoinositol-pentakisphosphate kinase n=1 Tax=Armillaria luteobubalina TaxID=153913 RepID=A0AA39PPL8_9AGAR|nr:cortical actin cytoskeleton protein asp1 [Armillaria luteobubalina]